MHRGSLRPGRTDGTYLPEVHQGLIQVREAGYRSADCAAEISTSLCGSSGATTVTLELPLNQPQAAIVCGELEQRGFAFAGVKPGDGADFLLMQFLTFPLDVPMIKIENQLARELVQYVVGEMRKANSRISSA